MKLNKFHITNLRAGPISHRHAIRCCDLRIGCIAIQLSGAARAEDRRLSAYEYTLPVRHLHQNAKTFPLLRYQVDHKMIIPYLYIVKHFNLNGKGSDNFVTGSIPIGMQNPPVAVRPLLGQGQLAVHLIKYRAQANQLLHTGRAFIDEHIHRR